jgi:addiction module HigA family antidote
MIMKMFNPPHPGETLKELYLEPLELEIKSTAEKMNMTRAALSEIVNGRRGITPKVAIKLAKAFGGTAQSWINQQANYDLWQAQQVYTADDVEEIYHTA